MKWTQKARKNFNSITMEDGMDMTRFKQEYLKIVHAHQLKEISDETCEINLAVLINDIENRFPRMDLIEVLTMIGIQNDTIKYDVYDPFQGKG